MSVILSRMPALDAALTRFGAWWHSRAPRERVLLGTLAALLAAVVLIYGVIKPLQAARAQALADIRTYETLSARIRAAGTLTPNAPPRRTGPPVQVVTSSAAAFGVAATAEPIPGGARATIADGSYDSILAWLADLGATSSLSVRAASIQRRPTPGRVSATVEFGE
jgi:general secretion pathway protein M